MKALLAAGAAGLALAAAPAAQAATLGGLHDARYCEIIELRGQLPNASATVWNTIGLNRCPAKWWNAFDAGELATERGALAVLLNGPRHFLMDSVTASPGRTRNWHGQKLRRVATIPIKTAADIQQTPYTDRVVERTNIWRWKPGRTVYELVAPGGDVYTMQAYSQIRDRTLKLKDLRTLGKRLDLPPGWRYRARRLRGPLAVAPLNGEATIVQDELQNTYQLQKAARKPGRRKRRKVSVEGRSRMVPGEPGQITDVGTVTGSLGKGTMALTGTLAEGRFTGTFRLLFKDGSVYGRAVLPFTIADGRIHFRGTAQLVSGTGRFRGITSGDLQVRDDNTLDGQNGVLSVEGYARY
ncbi:MAG: hypothetical protein JW895_08710 [Thermoleophilaceae bacterium]|nr:hypothetical protein [Thermoleophilaceae bacterium]